LTNDDRSFTLRVIVVTLANALELFGRDVIRQRRSDDVCGGVSISPFAGEPP
jgi:hypothetical protein